jgi:Ni,Fe-hydrogenase III large subunit/Ni,Fe-hydrogenase III component G
MTTQSELALPTSLPGAIPARHALVDETQWRDTARAIHAQGGRLVALWGSDERARGGGFAMHCALDGADGLHWLTLPLDARQPEYPDLASTFPAAGRLQRAAFDLLGLRARDAADARPWLRHDAWSGERYPLRKDDAPDAPVAPQPYPFVMVRGDGVHEIPVGPVHAGIIEPGHFRFSVVGERVLRLEERLGYTHKGIEKRFESLSLADGAKLAGRVSGDSTVAYAWAYAMALENASGARVPERAHWLRALLLERERIANHLGDLGYLGNDVALAFGFAQFWLLKEDVLRLNRILFGHRYLMDTVVPGGVDGDVTADGRADILRECDALEQAVRALRNVYDEHAGVQDRFQGAGIVNPELAAQLGLTGLAGRASAQSWDLRTQYPVPPYDRLNIYMAIQTGGDVAARVAVRFDELAESLRLVRAILSEMPEGPVRVELPDVPGNTLAFGWVEGWRGDVFIALHTDARGAIHRVHPRDPSWSNWPLLEHAVIGNIVPDFPLINKSFNLSYSGADL